MLGIQSTSLNPIPPAGTRSEYVPRDPQVVKGAYTPDSIWRNRDQFLKGTDEIVAFLTKKWAKENGYRLRKELFAFTDNKVY
jgi:nuclear transport factor 2 (NTF2) superfamily protein